MTNPVKAAAPAWLLRIHAPRRLAFDYSMPTNYAAIIGLIPYGVADFYARFRPSPAATLTDTAVSTVWTVLFLAAMWLSLSQQFHRMFDMGDELEATIAARQRYEAAVDEAIGQLPGFEPEAEPEVKLH